MIDQNFFNDLNRKINDVIPDDIKNTVRDLDKNVKAVVQGALNKVDMVPRTEFDAQCQVLARTRSKLEALEQKIAELEQQLKTQ